MELHLTGDEAADQLLSENPFALLTGMLLDQQVAMETAFAGPAKLAERLGAIDAQSLAALDLDRLTEAMREKPAVHRYPGSMAKRVHALALAVVEGYDGDATAIWTQGSPDGREVLRRLKALPGFGEQKAKIFLALLGKQGGLQADGWRETAGAYGETGVFRSIADVVDEDSLLNVRETKRAAKAAAKSAGQPQRP